MSNVRLFSVLAGCLASGIPAAEFTLSRDTVRAEASSADSCRIVNLSSDTLTLDTLYVDTLRGVRYLGRQDAVFSSFVLSFSLWPQNDPLYHIAYSIGESSVPYGDPYYARKIRIPPRGTIILHGFNAQSQAGAPETALRGNGGVDPVYASIILRSGNKSNTLWCRWAGPISAGVGRAKRGPAAAGKSPALFDLLGRPVRPVLSMQPHSIPEVLE